MHTVTNTLNAWLQDIQPSLSLNNQGKCFLQSESGCELFIAAVDDSGHFIVNCDIMKIPTKGRESLFQTALELNLYQNSTLGAAISIDKAGSILCLSLSRELIHTDSISFQNILQNMITTTQDIQQTLNAERQLSARHNNHPDHTHNNALFV